MPNSATLPLKCLFILIVIVSPLGRSFAAIDKFDPYAFTRVLYDSNVFRLSGDQEALARLGDTSRDDTIAHLGAGFEADLKLSRQHLLLDARVDRAKYDTFDELDHTRIDATATWAWQIGNLWSGNLGYDYERRLRSFNQDQTPEKDMKTEKEAFLDAGYQIHPDWELIAGLRLIDTSYEESERTERDATAGRIEVQYRNTLNSRIGIRAEYTNNDLNDQEIDGIRINNDYDQYQLSGVLYWEGSAKSNLEARLGYTEQKYDDIDERDWNGSTGRLMYQWIATGKTKLDIHAWHETSTLYNEITTYVLTKGASIQPTWSVTPVITLKGKVSYENDDFKGENDIRVALGGQRRDDDTWTGRIAAQWNPRRYLSLSVAYQRKVRDSSIDTNDFDDKIVDARVQFNFLQ